MLTVFALIDIRTAAAPTVWPVISSRTSSCSRGDHAKWGDPLVCVMRAQVILPDRAR